MPAGPSPPGPAALALGSRGGQAPCGRASPVLRGGGHPRGAVPGSVSPAMRFGGGRGHVGQRTTPGRGGSGTVGTGGAERTPPRSGGATIRQSGSVPDCKGARGARPISLACGDRYHHPAGAAEPPPPPGSGTTTPRRRPPGPRRHPHHRGLDDAALGHRPQDPDGTRWATPGTDLAGDAAGLVQLPDRVAIRPGPRPPSPRSTVFTFDVTITDGQGGSTTRPLCQVSLTHIIGEPSRRRFGRASRLHRRWPLLARQVVTLSITA